MTSSLWSLTPEDHSSLVRDPLDADSVIPPQRGEPRLNPVEQDTFRETVFAANLEKLRASGQLSEQQYRQKRAQVAAEFAPEPSAAGQPGRDVAAQLVDLAALHDRGVLSDAEFQAQKARLLGET